jgi:hypothetical protein
MSLDQQKARAAISEATRTHSARRFATSGKIFVVSEKEQIGILKAGCIEFQSDGLVFKKGQTITEKDTGRRFEYDWGHRHVVGDAFAHYVANVNEIKKTEEKKSEEPKTDPKSS